MVHEVYYITKRANGNYKPAMGKLTILEILNYALWDYGGLFGYFQSTLGKEKRYWLGFIFINVKK